jgi:hypothetical protein
MALLLVMTMSLGFWQSGIARAEPLPTVIALYRGFEGETSTSAGLVGWVVQSAVNKSDARQAATLDQNIQGVDVPAALRKAMSCADLLSVDLKCSDVRIVDGGGWAIPDLTQHAAVENELRSVGSPQALVVHFVPILDRKGFHVYAWIQQAQVASKVTYAPRLMVQYESPLPDGANQESYWFAGRPRKIENELSLAIDETAAMLGWMLREFDEARSSSPSRAWSGLPRLKESGAAVGRRCRNACSQPLVSDVGARLWIGTRTLNYPTVISHAKADVFH